jgi:hypothetical protein
LPVTKHHTGTAAVIRTGWRRFHFEDRGSRIEAVDVDVDVDVDGIVDGIEAVAGWTGGRSRP